MTNAAKASINIRSFESFGDGSGAPATVECGGYVFACDWLDGPRMTLINPTYGSRRQNEIAARRVEQWYTTRVRELGQDWLKSNAEMYAD